MNIKPIRNEKDYQKALEKIDILWGSPKNSVEGNELDLLITLVEFYELKNYPILPPNPKDATKFRMEQMGISKVEIEKYFNNKKELNDFLEGKIELTLDLAKVLYQNLKIPAEVLLK